MKTCTRCGIAKRLDRFYVVRGKPEGRCKDCENARRRHRDHVRYTAVSDITPEQELAMRKRARKCPMPGCGVKLTSKPGQPNSKHLDHIVPLNQGGTHTHGNVRIICADCNLKRPKDGSDFTGQVTLWAQGPVSVSRPDRRRLGGANTNEATCRKGLHPWMPANIKITVSGKKLCRLCRQAKELRRKGNALRQCKCGALFPAPGRTFMCPDCVGASARRAAELHASGLNWGEVATEVGYGTAEGARYAAKRIGYSPPPGLAAAKARAKAAPKPQRLCPDCGMPEPVGRGKSRCEPCTTAMAWRAVELRMGEGRTLRYIADVLGLSSITSVTNLMKTVVEIESRMGRPVTQGDGGRRRCSL